MAKKKSFSDEVKHYAAAKPETPYQKASAEWDKRIGSSVVQARNWRMTAIFSLLISICLLVLLAISMASHKNTVYVAQVSKYGQVINVAPLEREYNPTQAEQEYFVVHFIRMFAGLSLDPVLTKKRWEQAYSFLTQRSAAQFDAYMKANSPIKLLGKQTRTVKINSVNPLSRDSYEVVWTVTSTSVSGKTVSQQKYSGVFSTVIKQPTTQAEILQNPLGIFIADFSVTKEQG
jgi:type IV secretion system protein VirB5